MKKSTCVAHEPSDEPASVPWLGALLAVMGFAATATPPSLAQHVARHADQPICVLPEAPFQGKTIVPAPATSKQQKTAVFDVNYLSSGDVYGYICDQGGWPQAAKDAFERAVSTWEGFIESSQPIEVDACWSSGMNVGTLGAAGAVTLHHSSNIAGAPESDTWYPAALANTLAESDLGTDAEIQAVFNADKSNWYFGAGPGGIGAGELDFETVVLHELGHGLGFAGSANYDDGSGDDECGGIADEGCIGTDDSNGFTYPEAYDHFVEDGVGTALLDYTDPSTALGAALIDSTSGIFFNGPAVVAANGGNAELYAPDPWESGSSYSHWEQDAFPDEVMKPQLPQGEVLRDPQLALSLLEDLGWDQTIPVELVAFEAVAEARAVVLQWQTASETNNAGFAVEHRNAGGTFEELAFVPGAGTTNEPQHYQHRVTDLAAGRHAFRLKQVDNDGAEHYSAVVEAVVALRAPYRLSEAYPNPSRTKATLELLVREAQPVRAVAYDTRGRRVQTLHSGHTAAYDPMPLQFNAETLPSGLYIVQVEGETFSATRRAVVVK